MATETRKWKELECILKKVALIIREGTFHDVVDGDADVTEFKVSELVMCDGPVCAQFHPNFKGCSFRR